MNKQTETALKMAKQHIIERKGGRGGAVCYVKSDEDVIKAIDEALEQQEARLVSYAPDKSTCTLNIDGEEVYFNREQPAQLELPQQRWSKEKEMIESWQQPAQEPVAWMDDLDEGEVMPHAVKMKLGCSQYSIPLYTHPAPSFIGLSDDERVEVLAKVLGIKRSEVNLMDLDCAHAIEQSLKEKNT